MKKISIICLLFALTLAGCNSNDINAEQNKIYEGFKESLLNNGELISSNIPFDYSIEVKEKADKFLYTVRIDKPQIAMSNVQMLILNPEDLVSDYMSSSKGIFDESSYYLVPNQENIPNDYLKEIVLEGVSKTENFRVYAMVVYKDINGLNQSQVFFSFNVVNKENAKAGNE